jgi:hypothetical protein
LQKISAASWAGAFSARQIEARQCAFSQAGAPHATADAADAGHHRIAAIRSFEVLHACADFVISRDPSEADIVDPYERPTS